MAMKKIDLRGLVYIFTLIKTLFASKVMVDRELINNLEKRIAALEGKNFFIVKEETTTTE